MPRVDRDAFLNQLSRFYDDAKDAGSVVVTLKRYTGKPAPSAGSKSKARKGAAEAEASQDEPGCIVRAVLKKRKISTVIQAKDQVKFQMMFSNILKVKLEGLKKRAGKRESKKKKKSSTRRKGGARD